MPEVGTNEKKDTLTYQDAAREAVQMPVFDISIGEI